MGHPVLRGKPTSQPWLPPSPQWPQWAWGPAPRVRVQTPAGLRGQAGPCPAAARGAGCARCEAEGQRDVGASGWGWGSAVARARGRWRRPPRLMGAAEAVRLCRAAPACAGVRSLLAAVAALSVQGLPLAGPGLGDGDVTTCVESSVIRGLSVHLCLSVCSECRPFFLADHLFY